MKYSNKLTPNTRKWLYGRYIKRKNQGFIKGCTFEAYCKRTVDKVISYENSYI